MTSRKYFLGMLAILMIVISRIAFAESTQTFAIPECRAIATISFSKWAGPGYWGINDGSFGLYSVYDSCFTEKSRHRMGKSYQQYR